MSGAFAEIFQLPRRSRATISRIKHCRNGQTMMAPRLPTAVLYYADVFHVDLPKAHRFPMHKYRLVRESIEQHPSILSNCQMRVSPLAAIEDLHLVHDRDYVARFLENRLDPQENRKIGFPWSIASVQRTLASTGGTVAAMREVLDPRRPYMLAGQLAGGTHHAYVDRGEGFCIFNDIAVASRVAMRDFGISRILVFDLDVHQGNGTAKIFENEPMVTTFSVHGAKNYPLRKEQSNYDVELEDDAGDEPMLRVVRHWLPRLLEAHQPELLFFQAGVDALAQDSLGRLGMTRTGLMERNQIVIDTCLSRGIPLVVNMGGGYSRPIDASVECHADVFLCMANRIGAVRAGGGLASAM